MSDNNNRGKKQIRLRRIVGTGFKENRSENFPALSNNIVSTPKKVPLYGVGSVKANEQKIKENLMKLKINAQKKKIAQALYYGDTGLSPLKRTVAAVSERNKKPVHARLGSTKHVRLQKVPIMIDTNRILKTKARLQRQHPGMRRLYSAQHRLQKIRQQQLLQQQGATVGKQNLTKPANKVRLQRTRPFASLTNQPTNLTVKVDNSNRLAVDESTVPRHRPIAALNPKLQAQIKYLQRNSINKEPTFIPCERIYVDGIGCTSISLHERFSLL